jgi:hypothetical protein
MKSLIITALLLSFSQVACASGAEVTAAAPIVEVVNQPEAIGFEITGLTTIEDVKVDLQIIEDETVIIEGNQLVEEVIAEDLKITETVIEPMRPLFFMNGSVEVKQGKLLGSL